MKLFFKVGCLGLVLGLITPAVFAQSEFQIKLLVGSDTTPPTTPTITALTPVAETQIDISWSVSIDDVSLQGYRLFRDGIQIATTTQNTYNDTGLTASTTYSYTVDAFDYFNNFSSTSPAVATTTWATVVIPPPATTTPDNYQSSGSLAKAKFNTFEVVADENKAEVLWTTSVPTRYIIKWGRTNSYELGSVSGSVFKLNHETTINQLEPGTRYFYEVTIINGQNIVGEVRAGEFTTKSKIDPQAPVNVLNFKAKVDGESASLSWQNPALANFAKVRVVKSPLFYPINPTDGAIVYEGTGESVFDKLALSNRSPQYYTIFVYDQAGNISSGAVAIASKKSIETPITSTSSTSSPPEIKEEEIGDESILMASAVMIKQLGTVQSLHLPITLLVNEPYVISIPAKALPPHLKSIIATIEDQTNNQNVSVYLLKLNTTGDYYQAVIPAGLVVGQSKITIEVFDYQAATIRRLSNQAIFISANDKLPFPDRFLQLSFWWPILFFAGLWGIIYFIFWFSRRRREDNR